jgi:hypothetical protein
MPLKSTLREFDKQKRIEYHTLKPWITSSHKRTPFHPKPKKKRKKNQKIGPKVYEITYALVSRRFASHIVQLQIMEMIILALRAISLFFFTLWFGILVPLTLLGG